MAKKRGSKNKPIMANNDKFTEDNQDSDIQTDNVLEQFSSSNSSNLLDETDNQIENFEKPIETITEREKYTEKNLIERNLDANDAYSPGKALKKAREQAGVSLQTIASQTAIPLNKLELLENDQFDELGAQLFIIAYLKKYAALLNLPQEELIADFKVYRSAVDDHQPQENDRQKSASLKRGLLLGASSTPSSFPRSSSYVGSSQQAFYTKLWFWLFLLCGLGVWAAYEFALGPRSIINEPSQELLLPPNLGDGMSKQTDSSVQIKSDSHSSKLKENALTIENPSNILDDEASNKTEENRLVAGPDNTVLTINPNIVGPNTFGSNKISEAVSLSDELISEPEDESSISDEEAFSRQLIDTDSKGTSIEALTAAKNGIESSTKPQLRDGSLASEAAPSSTAVGNDRLDLDFNDDCWLEVVDRLGVAKIAKLMRRGDNLRLFGEAPFEVKVGNSRAVQIHLNGRLIDVPVNPNRRTARFSVQVTNDGL